MADYNDVPLVATGDYIDASWLNTYLGDNFRALFPYTAAGDIGYASDANTLARLAAVNGGLLKSSAMAPSWLTIGSTNQILTVVGGQPTWSTYQTLVNLAGANNYGSQTTSNSVPVDITSLTVSFTTTRKTDLWVIGSIIGYTSNGSYPIKISGNLDTSISFGDFRSYNTSPDNISIFYLYGGVAAGAHTIKAQFSSPNAIDVTTFGGQWSVLATPTA